MLSIASSDDNWKSNKLCLTSRAEKWFPLKSIAWLLNLWKSPFGSTHSNKSRGLSDSANSFAVLSSYMSLNLQVHGEDIRSRRGETQFIRCPMRVRIHSAFG